MGLNIGALGNFAGGVAKGISAYQEQALREKEQALREKEQALREQTASREEEKYQKEREAQQLLKDAYTPAEGGVSTEDITAALPIGQRASETETTPEYRQAFQNTFSKLTPEQQAAVLKGYGSSATPGGQAAAKDPLLQAAQLGTTTVRKDANGQTYAVQPLSSDKAVDRYSQLAGAAGNPIAMKEAIDLKAKQQQLELGGYTLKGAQRTEARQKAEDELADWHTKTTTTLQEKGPQAAAEDLVKEYNTGKAHKDGQTAEIVKNSDGTSAVILKNDKTGEVVETHPIDNESLGKAIQAMAFQKWSALPQNFAAGLVERRENKKVGFEEKRVGFEEKRVAQDDRKIDALFKQVGFEGERLELAKKQVEFEASKLGIDAGKLGLEWAKFNEEVKNNPKKMAEIDAKIKNYNADANYRNAAAKSMGEKTGNWQVIGVDKDGEPISYNKNDGKAARADGKPIQDVEIFKKITGEKAAKEPISNADMLKFLEQMGDAPSGIKDKNTGKDLRIRDLPLDQQKQSAEEFFQKGSGHSTLPAPNPANMVKPGADKTTASALPVDSRPRGQNVAPELQNQSSHKLYAAEIFLQEAQKEADAAVASGNQQAIITAGNKLNAARAARDAAASSPLLPR